MKILKWTSSAGVNYEARMRHELVCRVSSEEGFSGTAYTDISFFMDGVFLGQLQFRDLFEVRQGEFDSEDSPTIQGTLINSRNQIEQFSSNGIEYEAFRKAQYELYSEAMRKLKKYVEGY
jgi:hypothetical protein